MLMKNSERALVRIIREIAGEEGMEYKSFSYDWVIKLTKAGESRLILGYGFPLNSSSAAAVCTDKAAASALMDDGGIPCVQHRFFMNPAESKYIGGQGNWAELTGMLAHEHELVCKPNQGTGGAQVYRVNSLPALENAVTQIFSSNRGMAVCRYHDIRSEHRVVMLDGQAQVIYEKKLPFVVGDGHSTVSMLTAQKYPIHKDDLSGTGYIPARGELVEVGWMHNLGRGSAPELVDLSGPLAKQLEKLAQDAAAACGVRFASVDIINADGRSAHKPLVLEINSGVMMEEFAGVSDDFYAIAKGVYQKAVYAMW